MQKADAEETRVAWWSRLLASLFVATAAFILASTAASSWENTRSLSELWPGTFSDALSALLIAYLVFLFAFVAFTGRAPTRFMPGSGHPLGPRAWNAWLREAAQRTARLPPLPPPGHPAREAAARLRRPVCPWWLFWLALLCHLFFADRLYRLVEAPQTPFWDFLGPFAMSMLVWGLLLLYFIVRRLEDLTTVWHSRWPGKGFHP